MLRSPRPTPKLLELKTQESGFEFIHQEFLVQASPFLVVNVPS